MGSQSKVVYNEDKHRRPVTGRIRGLREEVLKAPITLCSERALLVTQSYQETESEPAVIRRAKALKKVLDHMTVIIWDDELVVGNHASRSRRSAPVFPEWGTFWLEDELDEILETRVQDKFVIAPEVKTELKSIFSYWRGRTVYEKYRSMVPEEVKKARETFIFTRDLFERGGYGHATYDIPKVLSKGLKGLREEVLENMGQLDLTRAEDQDRRLFYEAVLIVFDGIVNFANRFAKEAEFQAAAEKDPVRKRELETMAQNCRRVPENPASTFWEALQSFWFLQLVIQIETNGNSVSPGRLDQYFYPYFKKDVEAGLMTVDSAQELLDCIWLKLNEIIKVWDTEATGVHPGFTMAQDVTIGGQTPEGEDATNDLSYLILNSQDHIRLQMPQFTVRIHAGTPDDFLMRVVEIIRLGTGMPALFGDDTCIAAILRTTGVPIERARDFRIIGCCELAPRGFMGRVNGAYLNVARVVDLAINNGVDRLTGKQIGPATGDPGQLKSFDDVLNAVKTQMAYFIKLNTANNLIVDMVQRQETPHVFLSSVLEGCIESGKDLTWGGTLYGATPTQAVGLATGADSLMAVKRVVFDEQEISLAELKDALDRDFEGPEGQRIQKMLLAAPKYGNDHDEADAMMRLFTDLHFDILESHRDIDGRPYTGFILTLGSTVPHGRKTGATANGRKAKTPTSDSMSPTNGADKFGPTAVLNSASKIDQVRTMQGNILNIKFSKMVFQDRDSLKRLADLIRTYLVDLKGLELQINVVDTAVLKEAQSNPEKYSDLIIRVAGYSARFVELSKAMQDDIIGRTENLSL